METTVQYIAVPPDNALAVLDQFATSKAGIHKFADLVIAEVREGRVDPLKVLLYSKTLEEIAKILRSELNDSFISEAEKYGQKKFEAHGAEIELKDVGVSYDYSKCGHPGYNDCEKILRATGERMRELEAFLKTIKAPIDLRVEDELVTVHPPVRKGKSGIAITIK